MVMIYPLLHLHWCWQRHKARTLKKQILTSVIFDKLDSKDNIRFGDRENFLICLTKTLLLLFQIKSTILTDWILSNETGTKLGMILVKLNNKSANDFNKY